MGKQEFHRKNRVVKANKKTFAAKFNSKVLDAIQGALLRDPEANLKDILSPNYVQKLRSFQETEHRPKQTKSGPRFSQSDIRSRIDVECPVAVIATIELLVRPENEVLYESSWAASVMVIRVSEHIVAKITASNHGVITEHAALVYLEENHPDFPVPRPHGLVQIGNIYVLFTSFIPGLNLEEAWPRLDDTQKLRIRDQLELLFVQLRAFAIPENGPIGGMQGTGCKDARRAIRVSSETVMSSHQFEDFVFSGFKFTSPLYVNILRNLLPTEPARCVFTHGDVRPANFMVEQDERGAWNVISIIDWEQSGIYPEYWECIKATNNLTPRDNSDWYQYLPQSVSPAPYPTQWLVDRLLDRSMPNT